VSVGVGGFSLAIVGESHYQEELERLRSAIDEGQRWLVARFHIRREPMNPYDSNAIVVTSARGETVGYFSRSDAKRYTAALDRLEAHYDTIWCRGCLQCGTDAKPSIGVVLDVLTPEDMTALPIKPRARKSDTEADQRANDGFVDLVGESKYQETLRSLSNSFETIGRAERTFAVKLVPEPDKPMDPHAVAVKTDGNATIGYLGKRHALQCQQLIRSQRDVVTCLARLKGGSPTKPSIGVEIDFALIMKLQGRT
jgi:HIRAN domain